MDKQLEELVTLWLKWDQNEKTKAEVKNLVEQKAFDKLRSCMVGRLSFGTAGMRAEMAAGFNRFNDLTIIQTAQGFLCYLQKNFSCELLKENGVVFGYDGRHNSERFALLIANIFLRNCVKVHLFSKLVPTPFVSYAIRKYKCLSGAMVTASHNPKQDNGFKVYWSNGAQILSPHDTSICASILENLEPWPCSWDTSCVTRNCLYNDPLADIFSKYTCDALSFSHYKPINEKCCLKFTYTPFHGVGRFYTPVLLEKFGFKAANIVYVKEQIDPNPDFPTVSFPNPEEGASVLKLAFETADKNCSTIVLANDPDADRFQLAEKQPDGTWRVFTGNEMGGLLAWWLWHGWKKRNPEKSGADVYMINSAVSSRIVNSIAKKEGFNYEETLTGFKWMANKTHQLQSAGKTVLLSWEESIGYMPTLSLDKDGVITAALFAEYAAYLRDTMNSNFLTHLDYLAEKYGHHLNLNSYFICNQPAVIKKIFDRLRNYENGTYPQKCGPYPIKFVRDLAIGFDNSQHDNKPVLPISTTSDMITFTLENGSVFTLRASGTEPKIKYYIEVITGEGGNLNEGKKQLETMKKSIIADYLQPDLNNLISKV